MKNPNFQTYAVKLLVTLFLCALGLQAHAQGGQQPVAGGGGQTPTRITQAEISAIADPTVRANAQARFDKASIYVTQADGVERPTDTSSGGRPRLFYSPQKLTAADCLTGRHWELIGGYAGCVCDGDTTHTRVSNDDPAACVAPPPPPPAPPVPVGGGGGGGGAGFTFGGLGSPMGSGTPISSAISGTWAMTSNNGSSVAIAFSGNIGSLMGAFTGSCTFSVFDAGSGNFGLSGPCGAGMAYSWGAVSISITQPNFTGTMSGSFDQWGASGTISATLNAGVQLYSITQGGSNAGFIMMDSSGNFNGFGLGNSISGYLQGNGAITLGGGVYYAAMSGSGAFGTLNADGVLYSLGGSIGSFFMVNMGGGQAGNGTLFSIPAGDPGWIAHFATRGITPMAGFDRLLSVALAPGGYWPCISRPTDVLCSVGGAPYTLSSP